MSGSALAGVEGMKPTTATRALPDTRVISRFRAFSTSRRSPCYVVRLPGELTDSGTTFALPPHRGGFTPVVVVRARPPVGSPAPGPANRSETQRGGREDPSDPRSGHLSATR